MPYGYNYGGYSYSVTPTRGNITYGSLTPTYTNRRSGSGITVRSTGGSAPARQATPRPAPVTRPRRRRGGAVHYTPKRFIPFNRYGGMQRYPTVLPGVAEQIALSFAKAMWDQRHKAPPRKPGTTVRPSEMKAALTVAKKLQMPMSGMLPLDKKGNPIHTPNKFGEDSYHGIVFQLSQQAVNHAADLKGWGKQLSPKEVKYLKKIPRPPVGWGDPLGIVTAIPGAREKMFGLPY